MKQPNCMLKNIFFLSLPLIFSNLINAAGSLISMFLISKLSHDALAAGAIITSTYGLVVMIVVSVLYSVSIMIGKMYGAKQHNEVGSILFGGIVIAVIAGLPLTAIMFNMSSIFKLLGQPQVVSDLAGEYFRGVAFGLLPSLMGAALMQFFLGISKTKTILYLTIFGIIVNSTLSDVLIFGYDFIPSLGMLGGGVANSITAWLLLCITIVVILTSKKFSGYRIFQFETLSFKYIPILLKIGVPISIQYSAEILAFAALTFLIGLISSDALAAQQIALQCSMISIMIIMAISQSGSILVSQALGKGEFNSPRSIANSALMLGMLFMLAIGIIYWFFPASLISLYLDTRDFHLLSTINLAKAILAIAAFTQIFDSGRNIAAGLLRGYGDTKTSMWTGIVSCWFIGIPAAIILGFLFKLGAIGIRVGIMMGILMGCLNLIFRFYSLNKKIPSSQLVFTS